MTTRRSGKPCVAFLLSALGAAAQVVPLVTEPEDLREIEGADPVWPRQKHIVVDADDYFIDLVFYNYILKCFFLVDLKIGKLTHKDIGQMDTYVRMYDDLVKPPEDNPTIGLVLCSEAGKQLARYSVLNGNKQLFAEKYLTCLPTEEELTREILKQKEFFALQHPAKH